MNLLTSRWSPMRRLFSIEPVGILNAWTMKVRTNSARITATQIDSKYSRTVDLRYVAAGSTAGVFIAGLAILSQSGRLKPAPTILFRPGVLFSPDLQYGQKRLLRDFDSADPLHPLLPFFLFLQQLPFPCDVAAVTRGEDILAKRLDRLACDDAIADRRLNGDLEHLPRNQLPHLRCQRAAALIRCVLMDDDRQRIDGITVDEDVHLDERRFPVARHVVVERGIAARDRLQLVVEVHHDFVEWQLVGNQHAI